MCPETSRFQWTEFTGRRQKDSFHDFMEKAIYTQGVVCFDIYPRGLCQGGKRLDELPTCLERFFSITWFARGSHYQTAFGKVGL